MSFLSCVLFMDEIVNGGVGSMLSYLVLVLYVYEQGYVLTCLAFPTAPFKVPYTKHIGGFINSRIFLNSHFDSLAMLLQDQSAQLCSVKSHCNICNLYNKHFIFARFSL